VNGDARERINVRLLLLQVRAECSGKVGVRVAQKVDFLGVSFIYSLKERRRCVYANSVEYPPLLEWREIKFILHLAP